MIEQNRTRKGMLEDWQGASAMLEMVQSSVRVGVWEYDIPTTSLWVSDAFLRLCGCEPDTCEPTVRWLLRLVYPEDRYRLANALNDAVLGSGFDLLEARIRRPNGEIVIALFQSEVYRMGEGRPAKIIGTVQDITRLRQLEAALAEHSDHAQRLYDSLQKLRETETALRRNEARLKQAQHLAGLGVWEWDVNSDEVTWSDEMFVIYGIDPETFTGKGSYYLGFTHPEDREIQQNNLRQMFESAAAAEGGEILQADPKEFRIVRPDGTIRYVIGDAITISDESGELVRMMGINMDVTRLKESELALQQAQKLESLGVMASGVAHDFNNLLMGIMGQVSLARQRYKLNQSPVGHLDKILETAEQAATVTKQLLDYAGHGIRHEETIDLSEQVRASLPLLDLAIPGTITIETELAPEKFVTADTGQIKQVIMNLVLNAAESYDNKPGIVRIRVWEENGKPAVREARPGRYVCLAVEDMGMGMEPELVTRIFDPFFTTKFTGRGLGLAATLGVIQRHRGYVQVHSRPEEGTRMQVYLPAAEAAASSASEAASEVDDAGGVSAGETAPSRRSAGVNPSEMEIVLVIEDEESLRDGYMDILAICGFKTLGAANGEVGVAMFREQRFKEEGERIVLVLLDMTMPVMSGPETLQAIREIDSEVPVILLSGYARHQLEDIVSQEKRVDYLQKPFRMELLMEKALRMTGR